MIKAMPPLLAPGVTPEQAILTRLSDKFMRLKTLLDGEQDRVGESVGDTIRDIIGYCALYLTKERINK